MEEDYEGGARRRYTPRGSSYYRRYYRPFYRRNYGKDYSKGDEGDYKKKLEEARFKVLDSAYQKMYALELERREAERNKQLEAAKTSFEDRLNQMRDNTKVLLTANKILPEAGNRFIIDDKGRRVQVSETQIEDILNKPKAIKAKLGNEILALEGKYRDLELEKAKASKEETERIEKIQKELEKERMEKERILGEKIEEDKKRKEEKKLEEEKKKNELALKNYNSNFTTLDRLIADENTKEDLIKRLGLVSRMNELKKATLTTILKAASPEKQKSFEKNLKNTLPKTNITREDTKKEHFNRLTKGLGYHKDSSRGIGDEDITTNYQLDDMLKPLMRKGFIGVYMSDTIDRISPKKLLKRGSFIMNLDREDQDGSHWVGVYWDFSPRKHDESIDLEDLSRNRNKGLFYYDPFGRAPTEDFERRIKVVMDKIAKKYELPKAMMTFDYNENREQDPKMKDCGYHSANWILDMYEGIPFSTPKDESQEKERELKPIKEILKNSVS